jgi:hypothetical protein
MSFPSGGEEVKVRFIYIGSLVFLGDEKVATTRATKTAGAEPERRNFTKTMALIAEVLHNAGLTASISNDELNEYCKWLLEEDYTFAGCTMYDYFIYGEEPSRGSVTFQVEDEDDWKFAIDTLKLLVKHGRIDLNGVKVTISYTNKYATDEIVFSSDTKTNIAKLNRLKEMKPYSVDVGVDGVIDIICRE